MGKTEVYSWRVDPVLKRELETVARADGTTVAAAIEKACWSWLDKRTTKAAKSKGDAEQERLKAVLDDILSEARGRDPGGDTTPSATNENVRKAFAQKFNKERGRRHRALG